ncbi:unnamed protein product [Penicillium salamii]|nr:unnamed protein product [Penicillium salamii]
MRVYMQVPVPMTEFEPPEADFANQLAAHTTKWQPSNTSTKEPCPEFPLHTFLRRFERAPGAPDTPGAE